MLDEAYELMAIVKVLATIRAKEANLRHRKCFYWRYFKTVNDPGLIHYSDVALLLPPRREWARPPKRQRGASRRPLVEVLRDSIYRKVQGVYYAGRLSDHAWGQRLLVFVEEMKRRVAESDFRLQEPKLWLRPKAVPIGGKPKYRCISFYESLSDRVLLAIANKYLSAKLDPLLSDDCYAFRTSKKLTHVRAVRRLVAMRMANDGRLYVADCDLLKFFDMVGHDVARAALRRKCAGLEIDTKVFKLVDGFLASYSQDYVRRFKSAAIGREWKNFEEVDIRPLEKFRLGRPVKLASIGLPQGGALSGLLANLVLDEADRAVSACALPDLFYARYCDDMIFVAKTKESCAMAVSVCMEKLAELQVPTHAVNPNVVYGPDFFSEKAKGPYAWADPTGGYADAVPWVSFLGYCVRFDGSVRIRKESMAGHAQCIKEECEYFNDALQRYGFRDPGSKEDAVAGLLFRLVNKGIGRVTANPVKSIGRCWLAAYRFVGGSRSGMRQMRYLDRIRSMAFSSLKKRLKLAYGKGDGDDIDASLYFGKPFSYAGTAEKLSRDGVARYSRLVLKPDLFLSMKEQEQPIDIDPAGGIDPGGEIIEGEVFTSGWERASGR